MLTFSGRSAKLLKLATSASRANWIKGAFWPTFVIFRVVRVSENKYVVIVNEDHRVAPMHRNNLDIKLFLKSSSKIVRNRLNSASSAQDPASDGTRTNVLIRLGS
jgi:hypothetical protein